MKYTITCPNCGCGITTDRTDWDLECDSCFAVIEAEEVRRLIGIEQEKKEPRKKESDPSGDERRRKEADERRANEEKAAREAVKEIEREATMRRLEAADSTKQKKRRIVSCIVVVVIVLLIAVVLIAKLTGSVHTANQGADTGTPFYVSADSSELSDTPNYDDVTTDKETTSSANADAILFSSDHETVQQSIWVLTSTEKLSEVKVSTEFFFDSNGDLVSMLTRSEGNSVFSGWEGETSYEWNAAEKCLSTSDGEKYYYNEAGQLLEHIIPNAKLILTYSYDSDGYPTMYTSDGRYMYEEFYCKKTDLGNNRIQFDWYSTDDSKQGERMWYGIYQDGRMIEYHYLYLEPYSITFNYEEVQCPTGDIPIYLESLLVVPNAFSR